VPAPGAGLQGVRREVAGKAIGKPRKTLTLTQAPGRGRESPEDADLSAGGVSVDGSARAAAARELVRRRCEGPPEARALAAVVKAQMLLASRWETRRRYKSCGGGCRAGPAWEPRCQVRGQAVLRNAADVGEGGGGVRSGQHRGSRARRVGWRDLAAVAQANRADPDDSGRGARPPWARPTRTDLEAEAGRVGGVCLSARAAGRVERWAKGAWRSTLNDAKARDLYLRGADGAGPRRPGRSVGECWGETT